MRIALVLLALVAFFNQMALAASPPLYADRIAAVVNGQVILESDVKKYRQPFMRSLVNLPLGVIPPGKWPTEKEILDELIVIYLLEQEAAKKGIVLEEKAVDASIDSIKKRNNLTHDRFVLYLAANGVSYPEFRQILMREYKLRRLIDSEVNKKVPLSEEDAQRYFKENKDKIDEQFAKLMESMNPARPPQEQTRPEIPTHEEMYTGGTVRLRQITLKIPPNAKRPALEKIMAVAKTIYQDAMTGADFAKLAQKYSQDPLAKNGGDLGSMNYKDMVPGLQTMVQRLKPGDVTPPIKTKDAVFIFYLAEAKGRQTKKVPIPEKTRKALERQYKEAFEKQEERSKGNPKTDSTKKRRASSRDEGETDQGRAKDTPVKATGILTPEEAREYKKVQDKVAAILRTEKIQERMKEWIEQLKKSSIIEVKL